MTSAISCGDTMQENRRYLIWCFKQIKGIRLVKTSENIVRAYLEKSKNALKSMEVNAKAGITEWAVSASYYAKYFSVYALLSKIGVKCEIHDCTIALFEYLFGNGISQTLVQEFKQSKEDRIETQYYTRKTDVNFDQLMSKTKDFVLEIEKIVDGLSYDRIQRLQKRLRELTS